MKTAEQRIQEYEAKKARWAASTPAVLTRRTHAENAEINKRHRAGWKDSELRTLAKRRSNPKVIISAVYGLVDPLTKELFYVGVTENLHHRLLEHRLPCSRLSDVFNRIHNIESARRRVQVLKLQLNPPYELRLGIEEKWIAFFKEVGIPLLNKEPHKGGTTGPRKAYKRRKSFYKF